GSRPDLSLRKCCNLASNDNRREGRGLMAQTISDKADSKKADGSWPLFRSLANYRPSFLPGDLIAGLTLAAIAIPEQMATARLGGFSPQIGFFAFMAGSLAFAAFCRHRILACGV